MTSSAEAFAVLMTPRAFTAAAVAKLTVVALGSTLLLAGCATESNRYAALNGSRYDPRLGVTASEKVVADGMPVPRGGGSYLTGRPYVIAGKSYVPRQNADGYVAEGTASWYGDAFHGRRTANGEIFDKGSISAAHPTLPLPSYVRVTNEGNGRSIVVRVNDRGPYHGGRVMDVSQRVAETLDFKRAGTAHVRVEYIGRAGLSGSDDEKLMATLRTDGGAAQLAGYEGASGSSPKALASFAPSDTPAAPPPPAPRQESRVARVERAEETDANGPVAYGKNVDAPLPPTRPFDMTDTASEAAGRTGHRTRWRDRVAAVYGRQG